MTEEKYEFIKQIGHGAYGVVCSALNKKTNTKVAIKKVSTICDSRLVMLSRT